MTQDDPISPGTVQGYTIDIVSKDAAGNVTEHLRIHQDGREEKLT